MFKVHGWLVHYVCCVYIESYVASVNYAQFVNHWDITWKSTSLFFYLCEKTCLSVYNTRFVLKKIWIQYSHIVFPSLHVACSHGWCCVGTFVWSVSVHIFVWSFMLSMSLHIVCVVFPSLHVVCYGYFWWVADFNCILKIDTSIQNVNNKYSVLYL